MLIGAYIGVIAACEYIVRKLAHPGPSTLAEDAQKAFYDGFDSTLSKTGSTTPPTLKEAAFYAGQSIKQLFGYYEIIESNAQRARLKIEVDRISAEITKEEDAKKAKRIRNDEIRKWYKLHKKLQATRRKERVIKKWHNLRDLQTTRELEREKSLSPLRKIFAIYREENQARKRSLLDQRLKNRFLAVSDDQLRILGVIRQQALWQERQHFEAQAKEEAAATAEYNEDSLSEDEQVPESVTETMPEAPAMGEPVPAEERSTTSESEPDVHRDKLNRAARRKRYREKKRNQTRIKDCAQEARKIAENLLRAKAHCIGREWLRSHAQEQVMPQPPIRHIHMTAPTPTYVYIPAPFYVPPPVRILTQTPTEEAQSCSYEYGYNIAIIDGYYQYQQFKLNLRTEESAEDPLSPMVTETMNELFLVERSLLGPLLPEERDSTFSHIESLRGKLDGYMFLLSKRENIFSRALASENPMSLNSEIDTDVRLSPLVKDFLKGIIFCAFKILSDDATKKHLSRPDEAHCGAGSGTSN